MFIQHWKKHARKDLDYFRNAYKSGIENGDLIFSGHNVNLIGMTRIMLGDNLDDILEEYGKYRDFQFRRQRSFYRAQLHGKYAHVPVSERPDRKQRKFERGRL